jgi:selT/selW/selH-like putative selenoprotein
LAAEVKMRRPVNVTLIQGAGGQFEVALDGTLIFSKKKEGRFPELNEILDRIPA